MSSSSVKASVVSITPEIAKEMLKKNIDCNRKVATSEVDRYYRDMKGGNWKLTGQSIGFDINGRLIDGQHRLLAVEKFGKPVDFLVVTGLPTDAFAGTDIGNLRSALTIIRSKGVSWVTKEHLAQSRLIEHGADTPDAKRRLSVEEMLKIAEHHRNAVDFVRQNTERYVKGVTIAPALAAIGAAWYHEKDHVRLARFIRLPSTGMADDKRVDQSVIRLRDWLQSMKGHNLGAVRSETFLKTQRVILAYMKQELLSRLYIPAERIYCAPYRQNGGE